MAPKAKPTLHDALDEMGRLYAADPMKAVRGQSFIKTLHRNIAEELRDRLTLRARTDGVEVKEEATLFGSHKPKDVDVAVIHPDSGPLLVVGVRSQMSSVGNNVLTYYQDIIGECISLQDRFPMTTTGYVYLHPLRHKKKATKAGKTVMVDADTDYARYAKMYEAIAGRDRVLYKDIKGVYDQFAYMLVDFTSIPAVVRDDLVGAAVRPGADLRISTFVERMIQTFKDRNLWLDYFT